MKKNFQLENQQNYKLQIKIFKNYAPQKLIELLHDHNA